MASQSTETGRTEQTRRPIDGVDVDGLVHRAQKGDDAAFERLMNAFVSRVFNLAYRMLGNYADADDVTQEVFIKLHASITKYKWKSKFSTWLYSVAANACRSRMRSLRRKSDVEGVSLDAESGTGSSRMQSTPDPKGRPDEMVARHDVRSKVESAIASLDEDFRITMVLRDLQGLSYEEIAEATEVSTGTVKSRLARARRRVTDELKKQGVTCSAMT